MSDNKQVINEPLIKFLRNWAKETEGAMKRILVKKGKGKSNIYKKLHIIVKPKTDRIEIENNLPDYAVFVDKGRKPGKQPPLKSIEQWCKSKGIDKKAAFPIAREIGKRGLPATNFMKPYTDFKALIIEMQEIIGNTLTADIVSHANETIGIAAKTELKL